MYDARCETPSSTALHCNERGELVTLVASRRDTTALAVCCPRPRPLVAGRPRVAVAGTSVHAGGMI